MGKQLTGWAGFLRIKKQKEETQKLMRETTGFTCIFISHNMFHIYPVADRIISLSMLARFGGANYNRRMKRHIFDPAVIDQCALAGIGHAKPEMFDRIARAIEERYPGTIYHDQPWIYSIAGGAMIQMKLYFASLHEYIMIWGTPIGSEGHSGRHRTAFWDTVIDGETWYYAEGQFEKRIYRPGDRIFVGKGQACGMNFTDGVWALEYARGSLLRSIPFGLADEILSCRDFVAAKQTLSVYTTLIGRHWSAPYNRGLFKKLAGALMKRVGQWITHRLMPPLPREITRARLPGARKDSRAPAAAAPSRRR